MKRPLAPSDAVLWAKVAAAVKPLPGRALPETPLERGAKPEPARGLRSIVARPPPAASPPREIEPRRLRQIALRRLMIDAKIDLHGLSAESARTDLVTFISRAQARGARSVLVVTGKGRGGEGILRRRVPEWLSQEPVRRAVAGISPASRRDGGEGAYYVTLRRSQT